MRKLNHVGIPTTVSQKGEAYLEDLKVYITDYMNSANRVEYLRFEKDSPMHPLIQNIAHIAYEVPCLKSAIEGKNVIFEPRVLSENLSIAFIEEEGLAIELMEVK